MPNDNGSTPTVDAKAKLTFKAHFNQNAVHSFDKVKWIKRDAILKNPKGEVKFELKDVEVPEFWSERATNIVAEKYFRVIDGKKETSARQMIGRVAGTIASAGMDQGLFDHGNKDVFERELKHILLHQMFAFNSPVWFNIGVPGVTQQASACFIQKVDDTMESITDLLKKEMMLFKGGSGTGANMSTLRSSYERLSGGGEASGPVSFMEVLDAGAGVTKSGGTCLAPYQHVYTAEGPVPVKELAERGRDFIVLSYDPPAKRYKAKTARAWKTGVKPVVRVVTDKGEFHLSHDHPVRLSTGVFRKAEELTRGMSLFAASVDSKAGYVRVHLRNGKKGKEFLHRMVVADVGGVDLAGKIVHHRNAVKHDNRPENLEVMTQSDHAAEHGLELAATENHVFQTQYFGQSGASNPMHRGSEFWRDAARVGAYVDKQREVLVKSGRAAQMQRVAAQQKMLNTAYAVMNAGGRIDTFEDYVAGRKEHIGPISSTTQLRQKIENRFGTYEKFVEEVRASNHRVVSVEPLAEMEVYDVEVDCPTADDKSPTTGHNFVIWPNGDRFGSGFVVSNTRRAAKMVVLNIDHPDILEQKNGRPGFITCKSSAEQIAHDLIDTGKYSGEFHIPGNAYEKVGFQNANNSVRVTDDFMHSVENNSRWYTGEVSTGKVVHTYAAVDLWEEIAKAAWFSGDPGVQFDTTTNAWHTCPNSGRINASNPCSEYLFLDDTACNLGSINLMKFYSKEKGFDIEAFRHVCRIVITAMEILVGYSSYPSPEITKNSHAFRPLGLGYANLGALLMAMGLAYDSDEGRNVAGAITAIMSGTAYAQSAEMASVVGPFSEFEKNREPFLDVVEKHARYAEGFLNLDLSSLGTEANNSWVEALLAGEKHGYRNSQISVIAPTGTISFLMDCDTTGIEPMLFLTGKKKLVGGGTITMPNEAVPPALRNLGYTPTEIEAVVSKIAETGSFPEDLIKAEHRKVFQTAIGDDPVSVDGHLKMMAAAQPFLSGGISKTVNMPNSATVEDVKKAYWDAWELGLKCVAIYRDGCKRSQPMTAHKVEAPKPAPVVVEVPATPGLKWGERKRLNDDRNSVTHKFSVGGQEGYMHVGLYDDGTPGEVFIDISKAGSTLAGLVDMAATSMSIALQHGAPLSTFTEKFKDMKFEPAGFTGNKKIRFAASLPDYWARYLDGKFLSSPTEEAAVAEVVAPVEKKKEVGMHGDPCRACGHLTIRAGSCWVCPNCATTTGCG